MVDDEDYKELIKYKWHSNKGYADRREYPTGKCIRMHRFLAKCPKGMCVDHIDGNIKNNSKSNLRICTISQNLMNRGKNKNNTSGYKGVRKVKRGKNYYYYARIKVNRKDIHLGSFSNKEDARDCYIKWAKHYFKDYTYEKI